MASAAKSTPQVSSAPTSAAPIERKYSANRHPRTPEQVGGAFVDVFLGGLLLDRLGLSKWTNPSTDVVSVVRECLAAVTGATN